MVLTYGSFNSTNNSSVMVKNNLKAIVNVVVNAMILSWMKTVLYMIMMDKIKRLYGCFGR